MADDLEVREGPRQLTGVKQVGRLDAIAQGLQIGPREGFKDEQAARRQRPGERREQVALQIVDLDDQVMGPVGSPLCSRSTRQACTANPRAAAAARSASVATSDTSTASTSNPTSEAR